MWSESREMSGEHFQGDANNNWFAQCKLLPFFDAWKCLLTHTLLPESRRVWPSICILWALGSCWRPPHTSIFGRCVYVALENASLGHRQDANAYRTLVWGHSQVRLSSGGSRSLIPPKFQRCYLIAIFILLVWVIHKLLRKSSTFLQVDTYASLHYGSLRMRLSKPTRISTVENKGKSILV